MKLVSRWYVLVLELSDTKFLLRQEKRSLCYSFSMNSEQSFFTHAVLPPLIAAVVVGAMSFLYEVTISNILLFASVGALALILAQRTSPELKRLRITIVAYVFAIIVSASVHYLNQVVELDISVGLFITILSIGILMIAFDTFHPPAVTASLSYLLLDRPIIDLFILFSAIIILLIVVRFAVYTLVLRYPIKKFFTELIKSF